jgi:hypothetical protein
MAPLNTNDSNAAIVASAAANQMVRCDPLNESVTARRASPGASTYHRDYGQVALIMARPLRQASVGEAV